MTSFALPKLGDRETVTVDFKAVLARTAAGVTDRFEVAKDVAAMASVYGGKLWIGACEDPSTGTLASWKTVPLTEAQELVRTVEQAVRDRCKPIPIVEVEPVPQSTGAYVVVINIVPVVDQPVAVKVKGDASDGWGDPAWVFPIRLSTHTTFLQPDQIAMLMNPKVRRAVILLEGIPQESRARVRFVWPAWTDDKGRRKVGEKVLPIVAVDILKNALLLGDSGLVRVPLEDIESVWEDGTQAWAVHVAGSFQEGPVRYVPGV